MTELKNVLSGKSGRALRNATFELTLRCNMHCKMCLFRHADSENAAMKAGELTTAEWIDLARQAADAGTLSLLITGGEPMLRPDFREIWEKIYQLGFIMELFTNATLVSDAVMDVLKKYPPHSIGVTLYGSSPEVYEKVCGNGAMFNRAIAGMHRLRELPSKFTFRTTIIRDNYADLPAIEKLVRDEFHHPEGLVIAGILFRDVRGAASDIVGCRLDPVNSARAAFFPKIGQVDYAAPELPAEEMPLFPYKAPAAGKKKELSLFGCNAGINKYTISWDGKLLGCQLLGMFSVDARHQSLQCAWEQFPEVVKQQLPEGQETMESHEKCQRCSETHYCTRCPAAAWAETGSLSGWPEYNCRAAHAAADMFRIRNRSQNRQMG